MDFLEITFNVQGEYLLITVTEESGRIRQARLRLESPAVWEMAAMAHHAMQAANERLKREEIEKE